MIDYSKYRFTNAVAWILQHANPISWIISGVGYVKYQEPLKVINSFDVDTDKIPKSS